MHKVLVELPVERLAIGQYVSRLDRPWSETPFLFQGFEIANNEEIAQLRSLCKVVHVEMTATEAAAKHPSAARRPMPRAVQSGGQPLDDLPTLLAAPPLVVPETDPVSLQEELHDARRIFKQAREAVATVFDRLRRGGGADLPLLDVAVQSMIDSVFRNRDALNWLACMKNKDDYLFNHALSCSIWALAFGRHLGLDKGSLKILGVGAMLLDIGKMQIPDELLKSGAKPIPAEWNLLRAHVAHGIDMVERGPRVEPRILQMMSTHHERLDGTGYPQQLLGAAIPLVGRLAGIVDCYDAMTSNRHYARAKSAHETVLELKKLGGTWFDPELVELFIQAVGVFPTGTLVELNTGEVGVVVTQNRFRRLRPEVMLILHADKRIRDEFVVIDLQMREHVGATGEPPLWITKGIESGAYGINPDEYFL